MREEILIAGFGGQGIMFMGALLAYGAMEEGKRVTFFPSYGAEVRGGTANCTVIISDQEIGSPVVINHGTLIALNQASADKFSSKIKIKGMLISNSSLITRASERDDIKKIKISATNIAEKLGNKKVTNMVALGYYIKATKILKLDSLIKSLSSLLDGQKKKLLDVNIRALKSGYEL